MRRFTLYGSATVVLLCLLVTAFKIATTGPAAPPCPRCGMQVHVDYGTNEDLLTCPCGYGARRPSSGRISLPHFIEFLVDAVADPL